MGYLEDYLKIRRMDWLYEGRYHLEKFRENGFVAKIDDVLAGLVWAEDVNTKETNTKEAKMRMRLKSEYAEYGIGTELLETMVGHLKNSGYRKIYYSISPEYYAYQIYEHLEFKIIYRDEEKIEFLWSKDE